MEHGKIKRGKEKLGNLMQYLSLVQIHNCCSVIFFFFFFFLISLLKPRRRFSAEGLPALLSEVSLFSLGLKVEAPGSTPRDCGESTVYGEPHTVCPNPIPDDSSNVGNIQDCMPGLLMVISLSLEGRNILASVDTDATLSGLPGPLTGWPPEASLEPVLKSNHSVKGYLHHSRAKYASLKTSGVDNSDTIFEMIP